MDWMEEFENYRVCMCVKTSNDSLTMILTSEACKANTDSLYTVSRIKRSVVCGVVISPVCDSDICCPSLLCYSTLRWTSLVLTQLQQKALGWITSVRSSTNSLRLAHITYILTPSLIQTQCLNCTCDWGIFNHLIHLGSK